MNYTKLTSELRALLTYMDANVDKVTEISEKLQERIYQLLIREISLFDISGGRLTPTRDFRLRILDIENKINKILGQKNYLETVEYFADTFQTIEARTLKLHKTFNDLDVAITAVKPARQLLYQQALDGLTSGLATSYVQPVKYLLIQQVTGGASINDALAQLELWNNDKMVTGKFTTDGIPAPSLTRYATQMARDSAYAVVRTQNNIIADKYGLEAFVYVGSIKKDTRAFCHYLKTLKRPIKLTEVEKLLGNNIPPEAMKYAEKPTVKSFHQGLIPGTNIENFNQRNGGYNCTDVSMPVRA